MSDVKYTPGKLLAKATGIFAEEGLVAITNISLLAPEKDVANAARLAHCWNCHDELLEALEWMLADGTPGQKCGGHGGSSCCCTCATEKAKAAITKATTA